MKVYAVMQGWDYEGYDLDSVWASMESAEKRKQEIIAEDACDCAHIREVEVQ